MLVPGGESDFAREPFSSPDGRWLAYRQAGQSWKVSVSGGAPVTLCDLDVSWGATWSDDDTIVFGWGAKGVWRVSAQGGLPEQVVALDAPTHLARMLALTSYSAHGHGDAYADDPEHRN